MVIIWDYLIGLNVDINTKNISGKIIKFGKINGERTVLVNIGKYEEWFSFNEIIFHEKDLNDLISKLDNEILNLTDVKFSILNFFDLFPNKKRID